MRNGLRRRITYANVTATLALFVALGGSSYAAIQLSGHDIRPHTLTAPQLPSRVGHRRGAVKESSLKAVPRAKDAARLDGVSAERLLVRCPAGTIPVADTCIETQARAPLPFHSALLECAATDKPVGTGATAAHLRRAGDGAHPRGNIPRSGRRADESGLPIERESGAGRSSLHHQPSSRRRPRPQTPTWERSPSAA